MNIIAAVDNNWAIGNKGELFVSIPEDQKFIHELTNDKTIVYGRKTLANNPNKIAKAGRNNIILSRNKDLKVKDAIIAHSKEELFEILKEYDTDDVYVVGGAEVFKLLLPYCKHAYITKIDYRYEADKFFPNIDKMDNWRVIADSEEHTYFSLEFYYYIYENLSPMKF